MSFVSFAFKNTRFGHPVERLKGSLLFTETFPVYFALIYNRYPAEKTLRLEISAKSAEFDFDLSQKNSKKYHFVFGQSKFWTNFAAFLKKMI